MLAWLRRAIKTNDIALVTGQGGVGKSTALRLLQADLDSNREHHLQPELREPAWWGFIGPCCGKWARADLFKPCS
ncbi:MAG: hypothetical protein U0931_37120 [Vulcanimicrobiota bacterium]